MSSQFTVTRQKRWPDGKTLVEITQGNIDYTNPDALVEKYQGEFETFTGLTPALEAAIAIAEAWKADSHKTGKQIRIAVGNTHGMTATLDDLPANQTSYRKLRKKAHAFDAQLPKCANCGDILGPDADTYTNYDSGEVFCSEYCAEPADDYDQQEEQP